MISLVPDGPVVLRDITDIGGTAHGPGRRPTMATFHTTRVPMTLASFAGIAKSTTVGNLAIRP